MFWVSATDVGAAMCVGAVAAALAHREGRHSYRTFFWYCAGYLILSLAQAIASDVDVGWYMARFVVVGTGAAWGAYLLTLGALVTFRDPKRIECFRCRYIDWPRETDEPRTGFDDAEREHFQRLHYDGVEERRARSSSASPRP